MTNQVNNDVIKPIEYDHEMDRFYIPVNSRYEIQTKGKGSSFRIANTYTQLRSIVVNDSLHPVLEDMAKATNAEMGQLQATNKASEMEINSLKERVAELELTVKKWQENSVDLEYKCLDKNLQIAELQADNERLREALERLDGWLEVRHLGGLMPNEKELLKTTTAQSLAEHDNEEK